MTDAIGKLSLDYFTEYQKAWILDESPMKLAEKSRRIGWTYATSFRRVLKALRVAELDCWVSTRDLSTAKEFVRDCARWVRLANLVGKVTFDDEQVIDTAKGITAQVITFPNRSRIYVLTSNPDALAGKGGDIVIDEMALHKDQQLLWQVALPTASVWGYQIEVISTHRGKGTLFNQFCNDAKYGGNRMEWSFYSVNIVQACEQGLIERINDASAKRGGKPITAAVFVETQRKRCATEYQWMQEFMCQPQEENTALLTYAMLGDCSKPWEQLAAPDDKSRCYLGMDIGRKHDLSVIWRLQLVGSTPITREVKIMHKCPFHHQLAVLSAMITAHDTARVCIDSTGIGAMLAEEAQREHGSHLVEAVTFTAAAKEELAMGMLRAFQDKAIIIPDEHDIIEDLHRVEKQITAAGNIRYVAPSDDSGHADRFWALALALSAIGSTIGPARGMRIGSGQTEDLESRINRKRGQAEHPEDYRDPRGEFAGIGAMSW